MRNGRDAVFLLDCGGYGHSARTAALAHTSVQSVGRVLEHYLAAVGGYVDIQRVKLTQNVDILKQLVDAAPLERGQYLKTESGSLTRGYYVGNFHVSCRR